MPKKVTKKQKKKISKKSTKSNKKLVKKKKTMSKIKNKKSEPKQLGLLKPFLIAVLLLIVSLFEFFTNGQTFIFWMLFTISAIIVLPNIFWLKTKKGTPFLLPFLFSMVRTQKSINLINYLAKHAKTLEKISIIGLFVGFGLVGIDYWIAKKHSKLKRIIILIIGALLLGATFIFGLGWMFISPSIAPLFLLCLIAFILLGLGGFSLALLLGYGAISIVAFFSVEQICPAITPVIPGVPIPGIGVIVPFIAWISLGAILIIHEFSHGILLVKYKEKIRSVGLLLAGIFPVGAFVEQDDKTFLKSNEKNQLLVLSAGASSNLFTMFIGIILFFSFSFAVSPFVLDYNAEFAKTQDGVVVLDVLDTVSYCGITVEAPAKGILFKDDQVLQVNGINVNNISGLLKVIKDSNYHTFTILRNDELMDVEVEPFLFKSLGIKQIGVNFTSIPTGYEISFEKQLIYLILNSIATIIFFFCVLSFAVGMFNFLPSDPLDGGRMAKIMMVSYVGFMGFNNEEESQKFIGRLFAWLFLIAILVNLLPYVTMFLF